MGEARIIFAATKQIENRSKLKPSYFLRVLSIVSKGTAR